MQPQAPTRTQYTLRAHLRALLEREHPVNVPDEQEAYLGHSCISSDKTPIEGGAL